MGRLEPLLERNAVAQQDVDNARTEVEAAEAAYDDARKNREDAVVRAEINGRVGRTRLEVGARVTGPADLLTTVEQIDPVYVSFHPSGQDQLSWRRRIPRAGSWSRPGSPLVVRVVLPDGSELPRTGKLDYVSPSVDPATGTQELRASFSNADRALVPGQFVRVRLQGFERDSALAVPRRAVQQSLDQQFVLVVGKGDTVAARDIETGTWSGDWWIIERGLKPGERVVVEGVQKAQPGQAGPPRGASGQRGGGHRREEARSELDPRNANGKQLYFFVRRPVLAAVISIVIVLLGTFALLGLPVARYPQITPPSVQVTATYPGATAEDVAQAVAAPIEQQLSGLDGLLYYRSSNSSNGVMNLQVFFDIGRDQDIAAVDVQNAIKVAEPQLPEEVRRQGVVIRKAQTDILLVAVGHQRRTPGTTRPISPTTPSSTWWTSSSGSTAWATPPCSAASTSP